MSKKLGQAIAIRDHVRHLIRTEGKWSNISEIKILKWEREGFTAILNTPFNPLPVDAPQISSYQEAILHDRARKPQPNQLSVWKGKKVLSIEWANDGTANVISFRRGDWEQQILAL